MEITLKDKNGVILHTAKKYCNEDININIESQEIEINPSTEEQVKEGLFNKLTVPGDVDLIPENIKKGVNIFGVDGGFDAVDTRDATATSNDIVEGTTAYVNNQKIDGNVPNNGELEFEPSDEEQVIPMGLTSGGAVKAADITRLAEYEACLTLANSIENLDDYTETTATPEDLVEGKTAYSNGVRIIGTMKSFDTSMLRSCYCMFKGNTTMKTAPNLDTSNVTDMFSMFDGCTALVNAAEMNTSKVTNMRALYQNCSSLIALPQLDTSKVTDIGGIAFRCSNLKDVPVLNLSSVTGPSQLNRMFYLCDKLTDESLNNILASLITATKVTSTKTLTNAGLSSSQITKCKTLSNYQAFIDAGWLAQ